MRWRIFTTGKNGKKKTRMWGRRLGFVARLVFVLQAAPDEQKGVFPLKADENKNVFPMAYIFVLSMFWGLGHYGIAAVERWCDNAKKGAFTFSICNLLNILCLLLTISSYNAIVVRTSGCPINEIWGLAVFWGKQEQAVVLNKRRKFYAWKWL